MTSYCVSYFPGKDEFCIELLQTALDRAKKNLFEAKQPDSHLLFIGTSEVQCIGAIGNLEWEYKMKFIPKQIFYRKPLPVEKN